MHAHYLGDSAYAGSNSNVVKETVFAGASLALQPPATTLTPFYPLAIAVGDFNRDGKTNLIVANNSPFITVLLGNGDGTFQTAGNYPVANSSLSVAVADFNGDGKPDVAVASLNIGTISILLGNGDGTFQPAVNYSVPGELELIAAADFNGDGIPDLVASAYGAVTVLLGHGDGTFGAPKTVSTVNAFAMAVGDFNGDGIADLAISVYTDQTLTILLGNGDGTFQAGATYNLSVHPRELLVADFNRDGKDDLALASWGTYGLAVLIGNGDGSFQPALAYGDPIENDAETSIAVGDFHGNGILDIALSNYTEFGVTIFPGNGDGTFSVGQSYAMNYSTSFPVVADFNGDGKADLAASAAPDSGEPGVIVMLGGPLPDLSIALAHASKFMPGQGGAQYSISVSNVGQAATIGAAQVTDTLPSGFSATAIAGGGWACTLVTLVCTRSDALAGGASYPNITVTASIAGNVTGNATDTATVSGGGDQNPWNNTATDVTPVQLSTPVSLTSSPNPSILSQAVVLTASITSAATGSMTFLDGATILGDGPIVNGQAILTTVLLPAGTRNLTVEYSGDSAYAPKISAIHTQTVLETAINGLQPFSSYSTDSQPQWIAEGDFNLDGKLDLVTANGAGDVSVFLGNGDGTFQPVRNYVAGRYVNFVTVADVNGDGKPDLVVLTNGIAVLLGNGDGTFQDGSLAPLDTYLQNEGVRSLVVADLNLDGIPDLIGITSGNTMVTLLGNGDGTFQPPLVRSGVGSGSLFIADFNGDGTPDLITVGFAVSTALGNGDGTFQDLVTLINYPPPDAVAVGDFNGDGKLDIAITYWFGVEVMPGNGDGTFRAPIATPVSASAATGSVAIAGDFNGDGKLDLAYRGQYGAPFFAMVFGNGDGTFSSAVTFVTEGYAGNLVTGDFNRDGKPDIAVANPSGANIQNRLDVFLGGQFSGLNISSTHTGYFVAGQVGAAYQLNVINPGYASPSSIVTVTDTLPAGLTATAISGTGWNCTPSSLTCTRSDGLATLNSYSPITVTVKVSGSLPPGTVNNRASVLYSGTLNTTTDPTLIVLPTVTTLNVSPGGSTLGQAVTFTASVSGATSGKVTFRDGVILLGGAPLVGGQATFTTSLLPAGSRSLSASFEADSTHAISGSVPRPFTVSAAFSSTLGNGLNYTTGRGPVALVMGDFNGDGISDLVVSNFSDNTVSVLLGAGNGFFHQKVDYVVGTSPVAIATGDFNDDGKQDLAVVNQNGNSLSILLGKGDGTFQAAVNYATGNLPIAVAVADFNGDGIADLAIANLTDGTVSVLFGVGDGTFRPASANPDLCGWIAHRQ